MDYHSDRFTDHSMMIYKKNRLVAIIPANIAEKEVLSHAGLTYGGIITKDYTNVTEMGAMLDATLNFLKSEGIESFHLKIMPSFLQEGYGSGLEYFLYRHNAELTGRDMNFVVDLRNGIQIHKSKLKKLNTIDPMSLVIQETNDLAPFWNEILIPVLHESHGVSPVHSLEEISLLKDRFPQNIRQFDIYHENRIVAGMTLFVTSNAVKSQYGAAYKEGKSLRALDYLYLKLFEKFIEEGYPYFDMGTSTVAKGTSYNVGLSKYKEEFGAKPVNLDHYKLSV